MHDQAKYETIETRTEGPVAIVMLNRPKRRNAISDQMVEELTQALEAFDRDRACRAIVIGGNGPAFSAGHDLYDIAETYANKGALDEFTFGHRSLPERVGHIQTPVICSVHGYVGPMAIYLMTSADLVVAEDGTSFSFEQMSVGGGGGDPRITLLVGARRYKKWRMLGEKLSAQQAEDWGLINEVVAQGEGINTAMRWARRLASMPEVTVRANKLSIDNHLDHLGVWAMQRHQGTFAQMGHGSEQDLSFFQAVLDHGLTHALKLRDAQG